MRKLVSFLILTLAAVPAFAAIGGENNVPEPESIALLGIGAVAFLMSRRTKK